MPEPRVRYTGAEVQGQVADFCRALGLSVVRHNTGAARYPNRDGTTRLVRFNEKGTPDLEIVIDRGPHRGKSMFVETKATGEQPTMTQYDWIVRRNAAGSLAFWTDSLDVAMAVIPEILKGKRIVYESIDRAVIEFDEPGAAS